jgi:hypothetical protein
MWLEQFKENMESGCCKGVLAFLDDEYATSYTTVLELMYSQTLNSSELNTGIDGGLPVVLIMLKGLTERRRGRRGYRARGAVLPRWHKEYKCWGRKKII